MYILCTYMYMEDNWRYHKDMRGIAFVYRIKILKIVASE